MRVLKFLLMACVASVLVACGGSSRGYNGPEVTQVVVLKEKRKMYLMHHDRVLKSYRVGLGFRPDGHKIRQGDGRTPEGNYVIDRRNPNSEFYLSIGISYPNQQDIAKARAAGRDPGGDIFIHGRPSKYKKAGRDWTAGCIAVTNRQIEEIYQMVGNGTPISIQP